MQKVGKQLTTASLWLGAASPFLYGAAQLLSAPLYPGYDWHSQLASELGTIGTASSVTFNAIIALGGLATMLSAVGFKFNLHRFGSNAIFGWLIAAALVSSGSASVWAGLHPLPAQIHNPGYWGIGTVAFPILMAAAIWRSNIHWALRVYFSGAASATIVFLLVSWGIPRVDLSAYDGALQRLGAFIVYFPVAVAAIAILRTEGQRTRSCPRLNA